MVHILRDDEVDAAMTGPDAPPRLTVAEYQALGAQGLLHEEDRVELLSGVLVAKSPQSWIHARLVQRLGGWLWQGVAGTGHDLRCQLPLTLGELSEPEPEFAIVPTDEDTETLAQHHPSTALLVIEVALGSLRLDRTVKARLYAQAGIPEYWIVNPRDACVEVYRDPDPESGRYRDQRVARGDDVVSPAALAGPRFTVNALFRGFDLPAR